jgi:hypothetical protein
VSAIEEKVHQLEEAVAAKTTARKRNQEALDQFVTDCKAVLGLPAGVRIMQFLEGTFARPVDDQAISDLSAEDAMKVWQRRAGSGQVLGLLKAALAGGETTVTDHTGKQRKVVLRAA